MDYDKYVTVRGKQVDVHVNRAMEILDIPPADINRKLYDGYLRRSDKSWLGPSVSATQVIEDSIVGNAELDAILKDKIAALDAALGTNTVNGKVSTVSKSKRKRRKGRQGDELDIHQVYNGNLDKAWSESYRVTQDKKHSLVTLILDIGGNAFENVTDSLWQAAVAYKLVEDFTKAGKSTKIVIAMAGHDPFVGAREKVLTCSINAKNYNERITSSRLASMTHLGYFRTVMFSQMCLQNNRLCSSLGQSMDVASNLPLGISDEIDAGHTVPVIIQKSRSLNSAIDAIKSAYNSFN